MLKENATIDQEELKSKLKEKLRTVVIKFDEETEEHLYLYESIIDARVKEIMLQKPKSVEKKSKRKANAEQSSAADHIKKLLKSS